MIEEDRLQRADGETFHQKGQKVWLIKKGWRVTVKPQRRKSFGEVSRDSLWPDLWVWVNIWNKSEWADWNNKNVPKALMAQLKLKTFRYLNRKKVARGPHKGLIDAK